MKSFSQTLALFFAPGFAQTLCMFLLASTSLLAQAPELEWITSDYRGGTLDILTDGSHNVYATQVTRGLTPDIHDDILTIKYNPSGEVEWALRYDRSSQRDLPVAIALDASNNLYVLGYSLKPSGTTEMFLLKYNTSEELEWDRIFDRSAMYDDIPVAIAIDESTQDIIVTGASYITNIDSEIVTLRYNSAGILSMPILMIENRSPFGDFPRDLKVDSFGNVYVIGVNEYEERISWATPCDRMIVKYSPAGTRLWHRAFNHGLYSGGSPTRNFTSDLAFDENGDVYTIGGGNSHVTLLKYTSEEGTPQVLVDQPTPATVPRLAVHNSNNIYIAWCDANRMNIYSYNATGSLSHETAYIQADGLGVHMSEMKLDRSGDVYFVVDNSTLDTPFNVVMKYDGRLRQKWLRYSRLFSEDWRHILSMHIDDLYNLYLAGAMLVGVEDHGYVAKFIPPASTGIPPEALAEFERIDFSMYAREHDWCWNDIIIDWEIIPCVPPNICPDPIMKASLINSKKVIWEEKFTKSPFLAALPQSNTMNVLTLSKEVENAFQPVIVVDDNLVKNGFSNLTLSIHPAKNILNIKAETQKGAQLPFTITLLNKAGNSVWQEEFLAPLEKEIKAFANEPGVTLKISAPGDEFKLSYFPNPFSEKLNIEIENETSLPDELAVYTLQGKKIIGQSVGSTGRYDVNMNNEKPGLYILIVKVGDKETKKLIELKH